MTSRELIASASSMAQVRPLTICHFTVAHTELKSRAFHRELLPLATAGINVRYLAPMNSIDARSPVHFVPLGKHRARRRAPLRRFLTGFSILPLLMRQKASLYHFQDPELLPAVLALKLIFRRRVVYDAYEDFPALVAAKKSIPSPFRHLGGKMVAGVERLAAGCFDGVVTADPTTLGRFARTRGSSKLVFYNFPNLDFFPSHSTHDQSFDVVYRGGLSTRAGTGFLLEAMAMLASERPAGLRPVRLLLLGYFDDPKSETQFREKIRTLGLESNIEIRGRIPHEEMAAALGSARIGVSPLLPVPKFLVNIPVKIFEYWACSLPAVATDLPPMRPFFRHGEAGLLVSPSPERELARSLANSMAWLLDRPEIANRMGQRGRMLITRRFNNALEVPKLRRFCERIAAAR
jgi:glycosyltransferase involved in cell wall biosynthesis